MFSFARCAGSVGCLSGMLFCSLAAFAPPPEQPDLADLVALLDRNGDGRIEPFEGADTLIDLLRAADDGGNRDGGATVDELHAALRGAAKDRREEAEEMFAEIDENGDGAVVMGELPEELRSLAKSVDKDGDGKLTLAEFSSVTEVEMMRAEAPMVFAELDADGDGKIVRGELPDEMGDEMFAELDADDSGSISLEELMADFVPESATFAVDGTRCHMNGTIDATTPSRVLQLVVEHPEVTVIEMHDVPGSMDDENNLRAARLMRAHGLATHLPKDAVIASGGVDFFLAGAKRTVEKGARLGVHSWGGPTSGSELPRSHPQHQMYLAFYREIGIPEEFYWYTLEAAPAAGIHWMTDEEQQKYAVETPADDK